MRSILLGACLVLLIQLARHSYAAADGDAASVNFAFSSAERLAGTTGDYVIIGANVQNTGETTLSDVTVYLSMLDTAGKTPVDLEDWSAQKALNFPSISPGQSVPIDLSIHLVKPGDFSLVLVANVPGTPTPAVSRATALIVADKRTLNPGNVLPMAVATPALVALALLAIRRLRKVIL